MLLPSSVIPDCLPDVEGPCPFCLRTIGVWWRDPPKVPGVFIHELPPCERFTTLTADEFVAAVARGEHKQ